MMEDILIKEWQLLAKHKKQSQKHLKEVALCLHNAQAMQKVEDFLSFLDDHDILQQLRTRMEIMEEGWKCLEECVIQYTKVQIHPSDSNETH